MDSGHLPTKQLTLFYALRISITGGLSWAGFWAIVNVLVCSRFRLPADLGSLLIHFLLIATTWVLVMGFVAFSAYRKLFNPAYDKGFTVGRHRRFAVALSYEDAFERCLASLSVLEKNYILLQDRQQGRIELAVVPSTIWRQLVSAFGAKITI